MYYPTQKKFSQKEYEKLVPEADRYETAFESGNKMTVVNAREMQKQAPSVHEFFDEHGFCLLEKATKVKVWNTDYYKENTDIKNIYHAEVEDMCKNMLYPGKKIEID